MLWRLVVSLFLWSQVEGQEQVCCQQLDLIVIEGSASSGYISIANGFALIQII